MVTLVGKSRGLVDKAEDSQLSGCGFKSLGRILDGVSKASYYIGKRNKGSQKGHSKKMVTLGKSQNLCTTATLGTLKLRSLLTVGLCLEVAYFIKIEIGPFKWWPL